ncbi:hypothetical protein LEP1GSC079_4507 [Leptospira interrogans str. FPW1039]|uniref:Uncharacterized protein n=1 Tax=Leptospira interrogans str. FPW1039 TaxID=1193040 RepID=A0A0F6IB50_LEPIR|nr:hypothetical protein LEP1GSC099_2148 [Leptospira interrogans str. UI 08452]EMJ35275.1 hypothetical protein LEP1GSC079_4507 [Leptospira interrogans str. FPW1039]EMN35503.1 hypothetical protein LEP1GSC084_1342 [Leptospira interrogans serovar Medanensis str. L0448]EMN39064.1 hypothetical protein LEP1GSC085_0455 [Leptospira interrogans str. L0996]EMO94981.1 hypothetical protein LEP1GSC109_2723 [Leptospira interrogans str. UI 13372]
MLISKLQIHWSDRFHFCHLLHPGYREVRKNHNLTHKYRKELDF